MLASCSQEHYIPKPNEDSRLIHSLCSFGKDFMRETFRESTRQSKGWSHGGYAKRRREGGGAQQTVLRARLRRAKLSHLGRSYDICNAFPSPSQDEKILHSQRLVPMSAAPYVHQRITEATANLRTTEGILLAKHGSGGIQGDSAAGELARTSQQ